METSTQFAGTLLLLFLFYSIRGLNSATFTIVNKCSYPVWPGILSGAGTAQLTTTGFALESDETNIIAVPTAWSGRIWGRTLCSTDSTGIFTCATGDCGSSKVECTGSGAVPPATLAEFTLNGAGGMDFYDVSLVDGYNLPMTIEPHGGGGNCTTTGCTVDLNEACPTELKLKVKIAVEGEESGEKSVACKSACEAFGDPLYCCSGAYATPQTCRPSAYAQYFKNACPRAYSYAYDDGTSTFTCSSADYVITFCSAPSKSKLIKSGGSGKFPFGVDIWAGRGNGQGDESTTKMMIMALVIGAVLTMIL